MTGSIDEGPETREQERLTSEETSFLQGFCAAKGIAAFVPTDTTILYVVDVEGNYCPACRGERYHPEGCLDCHWKGRARILVVDGAPLTDSELAHQITTVLQQEFGIHDFVVMAAPADFTV